MKDVTDETIKYKVMLLQHDSIKFLYKLRLAHILKTAPIEGSVEDSYNLIKKKEVQEAAFEALRRNKKLNHKPCGTMNYKN